MKNTCLIQELLLEPAVEKKKVKMMTTGHGHSSHPAGGRGGGKVGGKVKGGKKSAKVGHLWNLHSCVYGTG